MDSRFYDDETIDTIFEAFYEVVSGREHWYFRYSQFFQAWDIRCVVYCLGVYEAKEVIDSKS